MNKALLIIAAAFYQLFLIVPATAKPAYYDEQLLNYRMTAFCAVVKMPPKALTDALAEWLKLDAKAALPAVLWFNSISEEYQRAKCGDA